MIGEIQLDSISNMKGPQMMHLIGNPIEQATKQRIQELLPHTNI
jgi:hypothetical protein